VSRIVNWGRWLVAAYLAVEGAFTIKRGIDNGDGMFGALIGAAIWFAWIWGVLAWSKWAHGFLVVGAFTWPPLIAYLIISGKVAEYGIHPLALQLILGYVAECFILVWVLLPSVRAAYWNKEKAA
jgi:hypothetical protein